MNPSSSSAPIADPAALLAAAEKVLRAARGTDDAPAFAYASLGQYPPLYAAAVAFQIASVLVGEERYPPGRGQPLLDQAHYQLAIARGVLPSVLGREPGQDVPAWVYERAFRIL